MTTTSSPEHNSDNVVDSSNTTTEALPATLSEALDTIAHLQVALEHSREIGAAIGILMERQTLSYEQAFDVLRRASQHRNEKVATLAADLVLTGDLTSQPSPGQSWGAQASSKHSSRGPS